MAQKFLYIICRYLGLEAHKQEEHENVVDTSADHQSDDISINSRWCEQDPLSLTAEHESEDDTKIVATTECICCLCRMRFSSQKALSLHESVCK